MRSSAPRLELPPGLDESAILALVRQSAPRVRLSRYERHMPSDPEAFRRQCRLRWSRSFWSDRGWDKVRRRWVKGDPRGPRYLDLDWKRDILPEQYTRLPEGHPAEVAFKNDRPRDDGNFHGGSNGLALQRGERYSIEESGPRPVLRRVTAPVFLDVAYRPGDDNFRVLLWFFFELNWTDVFGLKKMLTHEGDWEHVTLVYEVARPSRPHSVYFAQHNHGQVVPFHRLACERGFDGHPTVFCNRKGHPTESRVESPQEYEIIWDTWTCDLRFVVKEEWRDFGGAWGEVGNTKHTTGPLGPLYKRHRDLLRIKRDATGRLVQVVPKSK